MKFPREVYWDEIKIGDRIRFTREGQEREAYTVECRVASIDNQAKVIHTPAGDYHKLDISQPFILLGRGLPEILSGRRYRVTTFYGATVFESQYLMMKDGLDMQGNPASYLFFYLTEDRRNGFAIPFDCVATMEEVQPAL